MAGVDIGAECDCEPHGDLAVSKTGRFVDHQDTPHKVCALGHTRLQQVLRGHERRHVPNVDMLGGHRKETTRGCSTPYGQPGEGAVRSAGTGTTPTRIYLRRAPMTVTSRRERALQVVLVVLGVLTAVANIYPLVTSFLAGLRPTGGTTAPMFYTILATLGLFLVLTARNPSAYRSFIAYAVWSSFAHTAGPGPLGVLHSTPHRAPLARGGC